MNTTAETVHTWLFIMIDGFRNAMDRSSVDVQQTTGSYLHRYCLKRVIKTILYVFHLAYTYRYRTHVGVSLCWLHVNPTWGT